MQFFVTPASDQKSTSSGYFFGERKDLQKTWIFYIYVNGIDPRYRYSIPVYYIHTEKYSPKSYVVNFRTQISSSQSEERTMVFTREKMIRPIRIANDVFSRVRKMIRPIRSYRGVWVSRQNYRLLLQLAARFAHIQREKFYSEFFSQKKWKTFRKWSGIISFVSLSIKKTVESRRNNSGKG